MTSQSKDPDSGFEDPFEANDDLPPEHLFAPAFDLEKLVAGVYSRLGHEVIDTSGKREWGADFLAEKNGGRVAIQVKCSTRKVGVRAVRQAAKSQRAYRPNSVRVITNSEFTRQAIQLARDLDVRLTSRSKLLSMLEGVEIQELVRIDREARRLASEIAKFRG